MKYTKKVFKIVQKMTRKKKTYLAIRAEVKRRTGLVIPRGSLTYLRSKK